MNTILTHSEQKINEVSCINQPFVKRKRTFSESFGLNCHLQSPEKVAAKYQQHIPSDMSKTDKIIQQVLNQDIIKESTQENDSQESIHQENNQSTGSETSKLKKVTQAQIMGKTAGRWTKEEHKKFVQGIKMFGKDWKKVEDFVSTRSGAQIRSHAQKYFIRIQKKLKGNSAQYLNQTEDQCSTTKGLELFRQTILLYEEGIKDECDEDDDDFSCITQLKRQKLSTNTLPLMDGNDVSRLYHHGAFESLQFSNDKSHDLLAQDSPMTRFVLSKKDSHIQLLNFQDLSPKQSTSLTGATAANLDSARALSGNPQTNPFFLQNVRKQLQQKFFEIIKKKEAIMSDIYFNEKIDLFNDGRKYLTHIQDILDDIQKLSQKLTIINQISGLLDPSQNACSLLERLLILINEVVNLQKVLTDLIANNEFFNKPSPTAKLPTSLFQAPTPQQPSSLNLNLLNLLQQVSSQPVASFSQPQQQSQQTTTSSYSQQTFSQLSQLLGLQPQNKLIQNNLLGQRQDIGLAAAIAQQKIKAVQIIQGKDLN